MTSVTTGAIRRAMAAVLLAASALAAGMLVAGAGAARADTPAYRTPAYRIAAGDELSVTFPYNPELNLVGPVGPDGRFMVPMVGNLPVAGQTLDDVAVDISTRLHNGGIVADARPVVSIRTYGAVVYVGGEVRTPGAVKMAQAGDPLQAVISAGGLLDTARTRKVVVIHRAADGSIVQRVADLRAYTRHGTSTGIVLESQDIVFVPRSSIAEADLWVDQHLNKLIPFSKSLNYSLGTSGTVINH